MKIALASIATRPGDPAFNLRKMEKALAEISGRYAPLDLVLFPEACITGGFPVGDAAAKREALCAMTQTPAAEVETVLMNWAARYFASFRISCAALRPGRPETPPPG